MTSVTSDRLSASLFAGLFDRSMEDAPDGIRTTQEKDGIISLSGVIGDILPLLIMDRRVSSYVLKFLATLNNYFIQGRCHIMKVGGPLYPYITQAFNVRIFGDLYLSSRLSDLQNFFPLKDFEKF